MNIDEIMHNVDQVLTDKGMVKDYPDQNVRQMLYHLYIAIDTYRYMSTADKNKAGYWIGTGFSRAPIRSGTS